MGVLHTPHTANGIISRFICVSFGRDATGGLSFGETLFAAVYARLTASALWLAIMFQYEAMLNGSIAPFFAEFSVFPTQAACAPSRVLSCVLDSYGL